MYNISRYSSPIGELYLACDEKGLAGLWMEGQKYFMAGVDSYWEREQPALALCREWLDLYFAGEKPEISRLPLAPKGTPFRRQVWRLLCQIPYGQTVSYGEIAKEMAAFAGKERVSPRAVGGAVGHNPISIVIPCHRVVGARHRLTGYAGGLERKLWLLRHEGADVGPQGAAGGEAGRNEILV
jgi:methylated-DNA-[protein]-cysteine S-methyltransferase